MHMHTITEEDDLLADLLSRRMTYWLFPQELCFCTLKSGLRTAT